MKAYTDITILLDRSGSMSKIKEAMEEAYGGFLKVHQKVPSTRITLIQFDTENDQDMVYENMKVRQAGGLNLDPRGATPLIDAFVKAIDGTGRRLSSLPEKDRPDQVLFVVITDGLENASKEFKRQDVFDRVTLQHKAYKWQFIYLGANQDAIKEAATYGIGAGQTITFNPDWKNIAPMFVGEDAALNRMSMNYTKNSGGARGQSLGAFSDEDRQAAVDKGKLFEAQKKLDKTP